MGSSDIEACMGELSRAHPYANIPHEPFKGVMSLFNGDLHLVAPVESSRHHWLVESSVNIVYIPPDE